MLGESHPADALERAHAAGVAWVVCVGTGLETSRAAVALAHAHDAGVVRATVGLHPHDASRFDDEWEALGTLAADPAVVAVGECGFDLYYEHSPRAEQEVAFRAQIALAHDLDRTLVVHSRDAWDDTFRVLSSLGPPPRCVLHCFTGGPSEARRALDMGLVLSFSGIVTFKGADELRAAAARAPLDRVLVETDAPFLAPVPYRGRENEPAHVALVGGAVAAAQGRGADEVARATTATATAVFAVAGTV